MKEKKESLKEQIEETMACSAYAEAGEPCPIGSGKKDEIGKKPKKSTGEKKKTTLEKVEDTMACSAFAEEGEPCPIGGDKKESDQ